MGLCFKNQRKAEDVDHYLGAVIFFEACSWLSRTSGMGGARSLDRACPGNFLQGPDHGGELSNYAMGFCRVLFALGLPLL